MSYTSHSDKVAHYDSVRKVASETTTGVRFTIQRMSFGRRTELVRRVWELTKKVEFLDAGHGLGDRAEAALAGRAADRLYLEWGLVEVEGLEIDGRPACPESLIESGPEALCGEILRAIQAECGLNAEERKN